MNEDEIKFMKGNGFDSLSVKFYEARNCKDRILNLEISLEKSENIYDKFLIDRDGFNKEVVNLAILKVKNYIKYPYDQDLVKEAEIAVGYLMNLNKSLL